MISRILRKRRPAVPTLVGISLEEELALLRVELMYGLRVDREDYLRRKVDEREEVLRRLGRRTPASMLADLRGRLDHVSPPSVVDLNSRRRLHAVDGPEPA
ncbi:hypothetical protein ACIBG8_47695 [Nonomuraea sp. NPDC050556]|uniref:hypothetical protein n=1 Tax=Nonomuraea sp. NPDC050556 TaxID=3364369 RepID=UPI00379E18F5